MAVVIPARISHGLGRIFLSDYTTQFLQYLLIAGSAFFIFYIWLRRVFMARKIQGKIPAGSEIRREILYSLLSIAVFSCVGLATVVFRRLGWSHAPAGAFQCGWPYYWFTVAILIFGHDTWFYWTHRLMHWRPLYRHVHRVHHRSHNPTPWAAFSFHPVEAFVESVYLLLLLLVLPVSGSAILFWLVYMTLMNVFGHLGFELLPAGFSRHWLLRWHNTSVHHNMHHRHFQCNYGLYFNIWDRVMGTNHIRYEEEYEKLCSVKPHD